MTISVTYQKDQGKVRERQEDSCSAFVTDETAVLLLSDGMGGHAGGDLASQASIAAAQVVLEQWAPPDQPNNNQNPSGSNGQLEESLGSAESANHRFGVNDIQLPSDVMAVDEWVKSEALGEDAAAEIPCRSEVVAIIQSAFNHAQRAVCDIGANLLYGLGSAGCTLTMALINDGWLHVGHIGDSRAYIFRNGNLEQLTLDHSGATLLVSAGIISPEEARHHPESHSLYRFLGINAVELTVDVHHEKLQTGDIVLLCSDGLWGMVPDELIRDLLHQADDVEEAATALLAHANSAGGEDNISVAIAKVS